MRVKKKLFTAKSGKTDMSILSLFYRELPYYTPLHLNITHYKFP